MTNPIITSLQNPRVKDAAKLRDSRQRARQRRFVIDGTREIAQAIQAGVRIVEAFVCPQWCESAESLQVLEALRQTQTVLFEVSPMVYAKLAFGDRSEGILAVGEPVSCSLGSLDVRHDALLAVLEGVEKPGNVGAVLRSADAAGIAAVIVANPQTDLYNPNCIRASLGTIFTLPVCEATTDEAIAWLAARGTKMFAAQPDAPKLYTEADYRGGAAIVLGSEAKGLSYAWHVAGATAIKLPMHGRANSLNVSATAAVLLYEALRQRITPSSTGRGERERI